MDKPAGPKLLMRINMKSDWDMGAGQRLSEDPATTPHGNRQEPNSQVIVTLIMKPYLPFIPSPKVVVTSLVLRRRDAVNRAR